MSFIASTSPEDVEIRLSYRGKTHPFRLASSSTMATLTEAIASASDVLPVHQKIIAPAQLKRAFANASNRPVDDNEKGEVDDDRRTLAELDFVQAAQRGPIKLILIGPKPEEIEVMRREEYQSRKMVNRRQHPAILGAKPRSTSTLTSASNPFGKLSVHHNTLPTASEHGMVMGRLKQLSTDEAVVHVCQLHGFRIGVLTELLPHEHPNLLGLNENMGQVIRLRLRTDRYDGLRPYRDTRQVLLHELAHNKVNDHPPEFKILNSKLNAQVEAFERAKREGSHRLIEGEVYLPPEEGNALSGGAAAPGPTAHVLGGRRVGETDEDEDVDSRRNQILQATMKRLEQAEAEIERGCQENSY